MNWNIKPGDSFLLNQMNEQEIREHTDREYKPGYSSWPNTFNGLVCEHILTDLLGYTDDDRKFKDVFNSDGISVEVKSYIKSRDGKKFKQDVLHNGYMGSKGWVSSLWERKVLWKKDISNYVVFFERDDELQKYVCDELFEWNDKEQRYISVQSREIVV